VFGLGKSKSVIGLDIGSSAVKAVELKPVGKGYKVLAFGIESVPPDSIVDGAIIDGAAVADAIRRVFDNKAFKTKEVAASLSGNAVIVKKINLPVMTEAELSESIYWEAEQYIPFDIQDVNLDYQILNAGASAININILTGDQSVFTRDISTGGNAYTEALQKELGLTFENAEQAKKGLPVEGVSAADVQPVLHAMTENVLLEVQQTFDFFKATASSDRIDRIVVSGGASRVDGFTAALQERFGAPVEVFDPFRKIAFEPQKFGVVDAENVLPTAAVAVGLALRKAGDR